MEIVQNFRKQDMAKLDKVSNFEQLRYCYCCRG